MKHYSPLIGCPGLVSANLIALATDLQNIVISSADGGWLGWIDQNKKVVNWMEGDEGRRQELLNHSDLSALLNQPGWEFTYFAVTGNATSREWRVSNTFRYPDNY